MKIKNKTNFRDSRKSPYEYFKWRVERVRPVVAKLKKIKPLKGLRILDIGCGYGALSYILTKEGAKCTGTETDMNSISFAKKFTSTITNKNKPRFLHVKEEILPFKDNSFDLVILFDVIEHVKKPFITLKESQRVLKKNGILYVEFTPYYSLVGHHLYDYAKWPIHILPNNMIKKYVLSKKQMIFFSNKDAWEHFRSLNKLKISNFQKMVSKLQKIEERFKIKYPGIFEINIPFLNYLGKFKDWFTFSFEGLYRKT